MRELLPICDTIFKVNRLLYKRNSTLSIPELLKENEKQNYIVVVLGGTYVIFDFLKYFVLCYILYLFYTESSD